MTQERTEAFIQWLNNQLAENHMTDNQLARKAEISHSVISKARNGTLPKWEACVAIARALGVDPIEVFRAVGLVQPPPDLDPDFERLKSIYIKVPKKQRKLAVRLVRALIEED